MQTGVRENWAGFFYGHIPTCVRIRFDLGQTLDTLRVTRCYSVGLYVAYIIREVFPSTREGGHSAGCNFPPACKALAWDEMGFPF